MNKRQTLKTAATGLLAGWFALKSQAQAATPPATPSERFPGDPPEHKLVYQLNHADPDYIDHILNSLRAMIVKYDDNVALAVVAFGRVSMYWQLAPSDPWHRVCGSVLLGWRVTTRCS